MVEGQPSVNDWMWFKGGTASYVLEKKLQPLIKEKLLVELHRQQSQAHKSQHSSYLFMLFEIPNYDWVSDWQKIKRYTDILF